MGRYSIILKKTPEQLLAENAPKVMPFGIDQDVEFKRRQHLFSLQEGEHARVGIVYEDHKTLFYGAKVHFHGQYRFFCLSTKDKKAFCCSYKYKGNVPVFRIATIIAVYPMGPLQEEMSTIQVLPWVMGKIVYKNINGLNKMYPVTDNDFHVSLQKGGSRGAFLFKNYDIQPCQEDASSSIWQKDANRQRTIEISQYMRRNIKSYLSSSITEGDIRDIVTNPQSETRGVIRPVQTPEIRSAVQTLEDDFFDDLQR